MGNIALPKNVKFEKTKKENNTIVEIGPCFPGFGVTLGNSIRRVLLSSMPGAAPIGVVIEGVEHEFMALSHLKEDVLEFVLNLKQLRMKIHGDEPVELELDIAGKKEITAGDITKNSQVEIMNPDLVLGHITDMAGSLKAKIFAKKGMGFEAVENREEKEKIVNFIEMDSVYSPVKHVGITVENARVGKMTNWDKVVLDIITDGTISPEEAFNKSVDILVEQFGALVGGAKEEKKEDKKEEDAKEEEK
ncbi:DNA-directed RNA polymerase subunit alpha [Candidatus Parcubacteria bacterium]|nr:MAG: DNA-directed RNA polymerase subunit alpha [Candidatus Parcubacteria bacterium]